MILSTPRSSFHVVSFLRVSPPNLRTLSLLPHPPYVSYIPPTTSRSPLILSPWTDHVRNEEVLLRINEQRNILHEIRKRKANWSGHILRKNCLLQQVIEGKIKGQIEVTRRRGRRRKKLLDDLEDRRRYCQLKEEALDRTMWRNRFGRGFGPVVWQITDDDDDDNVRIWFFFSFFGGVETISDYFSREVSGYLLVMLRSLVG